MKLKKLVGLFLAGAMIFATTFGLTACVVPNEGDNGGGGGDTTGIQYQTYSSSTIGFDANQGDFAIYDQSMYYINDLQIDMGDPMIVYDEETEMYYASGTRGTDAFHCFASPNLQDWEKQDNMFTPKSTSWSRSGLWAPDIQKIGDKWYLYYTASYYFDSIQRSRPQLGVAVSDYPYGPYQQYTGVNALGQNITLADRPFQGFDATSILDSHVFEDDDGELYMYFSINTGESTDAVRNLYDIENTGVQEIWGVKMLDPVTWDLTTLTRLLIPGYATLAERTEGKQPSVEWETWSTSFNTTMECLEGPYMLKKNGRYILTYVANSYEDTIYNVGYALCNDPLGAFVKPQENDLSNMLFGIPGNIGSFVNNRYLGYMTGTGHASVFKAGDEYMFAYHAHSNRHIWGQPESVTGSSANPNYRSLAIDYLYFDENGLPYSNGPTYSLQRLPEAISGYKNLALQATFKIDGTGVECLNDNRTLRGFGKAEAFESPDMEAQFKAGTRSIEITFASPVTIKALNIYNSAIYATRTEKIKQIDFGDGKGIVNVPFNTEMYMHATLNSVNPHTAYNILLDNEITTSRIVITFESTTDFAVGEIEIIGK